MKRKKWTVEKITAILQEAEAGVPVSELTRKYGMSDAFGYSLRPGMGDREIRNSPKGYGESETLLIT